MRAEVEYLGNVTMSVADWNIENSYPARCITTDYSTFTTYISRTNVPANTPIEDTTYWKPIARLNQEILIDYNAFKQQMLYDLAEYEQMLKDDYDQFKEQYGITWNEFKQSCLDSINAFEQQVLDDINQTKQSLINDVNTTKQSLIDDVNNKIIEIDGDYAALKDDLLRTKAELERIGEQIQRDYAQTREELVTEITNKEEELDGKYATFKHQVEARVSELEQQMASFLATAPPGGTALSKRFGNSDLIGITQNTLTSAINEIMTRLSDYVGDSYTGVDITIIPERVVSSNTVNVNLNGQSDFLAFEEVTVLVNGESVLHLYDVNTFTETVEINGTSTVKVIATILGMTYEREKTINVYNNFFVGCGDVYTDIMTADFARLFNIDGTPKGAYPVSRANGQRIFIVLAEDKAELIEQIEMNDFNIPMSEQVVDGYKIYTSVNTYVGGDYVIDINY